MLASDGVRKTRRFRYRPRPLPVVLAGLFFAFCAWFIVQRARSNDRGLIINHLITLDTGEATIFYWALAVASVMFVVVALVLIVSGLTKEMHIELDGRAITAPQSAINTKLRSIAFAEVADLRVMTIQRQQMLEIIPKEGRKLVVPASMLNSKAEFGELVEELVARCSSAR